MLAALALAGCRAAPVLTWPEADVVLVSIDTLRADHLPFYGYTKGATPHLAALAREGMIFETAYSHCPLTLPSHASLFTGLLPKRTGVRDNMGFRLKEDRRTLAERFKTAGWRTGGAVSSFLLRRETGLARGFDFYEDALTTEGGEESLGDMQRDGSVAVEALAHWISEQHGGKVFAFLHLYEPHTPYAPPERYRYLAPYDGDIAYADELVGRFLESLRSAGIYDRAIVAVVSDHGEGLGDHGEQEHGIFLYREAIQVPLILRLPGAQHGGRRIPGAVGLVDVAPTLLDLAGLPLDGGGDGVSLKAGLASGHAPSHPVYSETLYPLSHFGWSELFAATDERYSSIHAPRSELFDLLADPGETRNIIAERPSAAQAIGSWLDKAIADAGADRPEDVPEEVRERLAALGYIGGGAAPGAENHARADPKDKIPEYEGLKRALTLHHDGRDPEAVEEFRSLLARNPGMFDAWQVLGLSLLRLGRTQEAISAFERAIALDPTRAEPHISLAQVYALARRHDLAVTHAEIASHREPGRAFEQLAQLMLDAQRPEQAAAYARRSLEADPRRPMSLFVLGVASQRAGRYDEALSRFRQAEEANQLTKGAIILTLHSSMADCLARLGREREAEAEFVTEIKLAPWSAPGRVGLAILYRAQGRDADARDVLSALIAAQPKPDAEAYWAVVRTLSTLGDATAARDWSLKARARFPADPRFR
jgi:arylsulfatase A-like enzyme/tetratricopeptide (TPR) repeat protein